MTIAIERCDDSMFGDPHVFTAHFRYFLEGSYLCTPKNPDNSTTCEPYQYYLQGIKGTLITLPKSAETV